MRKPLLSVSWATMSFMSCMPLGAAVSSSCCITSSFRRTIAFIHAICQSYHMIKYMDVRHAHVFYLLAYVGRSWDVYMRRRRTCGVYYDAGALVGRSAHLAPLASWFGAG